jgi:hypothetical protein
VHDVAEVVLELDQVDVGRFAIRSLRPNDGPEETDMKTDETKTEQTELTFAEAHEQFISRARRRRRTATFWVLVSGVAVGLNAVAASALWLFLSAASLGVWIYEVVAEGRMIEWTRERMRAAKGQAS